MPYSIIKDNKIINKKSKGLDFFNVTEEITNTVLLPLFADTPTSFNSSYINDTNPIIQTGNSYTPAKTCSKMFHELEAIKIQIFRCG